MTQTSTDTQPISRPIYTCPDCGENVSDGALIVSTVIGPNVLENICCIPANIGTTLDGNTCMARFLVRASTLLHAPIEWAGGGYASVFVDDDHFVKISPTFGPLTH